METRKEVANWLVILSFVTLFGWFGYLARMSWLLRRKKSSPASEPESRCGRGLWSVVRQDPMALTLFWLLVVLCAMLVVMLAKLGD